MKSKNSSTVIGIVLGIVLLAAGLFFGGMRVNSVITKNQVKDKLVEDSVSAANRKIDLEIEHYHHLVWRLDSISRNGGHLIFTNFNNRTFILQLYPNDINQ